MRSIAALLALLLTSPVIAATFRFTITPPATLDPATTAVWHFTIENTSSEEVPDAKVNLAVSPGIIQSVAPELDCRTTTSLSWECALPPLAAGATFAIDAAVKIPFRYGRVQSSIWTVRGNETNSDHRNTIYWRDFPITSSADSGPGTLRQVILHMNAEPECPYRPYEWVRSCRALFAIGEPVPADGWYTIHLATPLPVMSAADAMLDGTMQTAANTNGPAVMIDGSALSTGHGLIMTGIWGTVAGLSIVGFPGDGIFAGSSLHLVVDRCYLGVDPSGEHARGNGSRGISSTNMRASITNNVIGGNGRSGIFFLGQLGGAPNIRNNRIGVAAHSDTPLGNGASGIFIGPTYTDYSQPAIAGNVIANNAHFGIALTAKTPILVLGNTIRDNGQGGIDIGLDGPTESAPGVPGVEGGVVPPPVIVSAHYANGVTTITGTSVAGNNRRQILLYANTKLEAGGYAEGEQYLGATPEMERGETSFTFVYPGDLRGKFINGTSSVVTFWGWDESSYTTSEFGRAVRVD